MKEQDHNEAEALLIDAMLSERVPEPKGLHARIMDGIADEAVLADSPRQSGRQWPVFALAAGLIVLLAAAYIVMSSETREGPSPREIATHTPPANQVAPSSEADRRADSPDATIRVPQALRQAPRQVAGARREINATANSVMNAFTSVLSLADGIDSL